MIAIVDYGLGNVLAFANVYKRLNVDVVIARSPSELKKASKIVLPGVGAFDRAMEMLDRSNLRPPLEELALGSGVPVLGVCVGMQMLARSSDEGTRSGLGWIPGKVRAFKTIPGFDLPLPHMGWNDVRPRENEQLFRQMPSSTRFYFLHSYLFECDRPDDIAATATYGPEFGCAVRRGNLFGAQFHPEKSHGTGTQLLKNFADL